MRRRRPAGDAGSALVLALFFVTVFALFVSAVVQFADVSFKATKGFAGQRTASYDIDAGVETAIHRFALGDPCGALDVPAANGQGGRVAVDCAPEEPRTGGTVSSPGHAVLALGQDSDEGVRTSSPDLVLRGDVYSHSRVDVRGEARLTVQGTVSARGDCEETSNIVTARDTPPRCANTSGGDLDRAADPLQGDDPDYDAATRTVPRRQVVDPAACAGEGWLVDLEPGHYDDAAALSALTRGGPCAGKVVWFRPGTYYFDFRAPRAGGPGSTEWLVDDPEVTVVAGTPRGWQPGAATRTDRPALPVPGSCAGERDRGPEDGVQMVFGGESRLRVTRGAVDVCATPSRTEQQIAVYGVRPQRDLRTLKPTDAVDVEDAQPFENPYRALLLERPSRTAEAVLPGPQGQRTAAVTLLGYRPRVPRGSVIDSAVLRVAHRESAAVSEVRAVLTTRTGETRTVSSADASCALCRRAALTEDLVDVHALGMRTAEAFDGLTVTFQADLAAEGRKATVALDAVWLDVAVRTPETRKPFAVTGGNGFEDVEQAFDIGGSPSPPGAEAELGAGTRSASLTLAGYGEPRLPSGSTIESAVLRVAHEERRDVGRVTAVVTPGQGEPWTFDSAADGCRLCRQDGGLVEETLDLPELRDPAQLEGLTVTYRAELAADGLGGTARLDGVWLDVVHRPVQRATAVAPASGFSDAEEATHTDGATADARLARPGPAAATLRLSGYPAPAPGRVLDAVVLRVRHGEDDGVGPVRLTVAGTSGDPVTFSSADTRCRLCPAPLTLREDRLDLAAAGLGRPEDLQGLQVTYEAVLDGDTGLARLDGVELEVVSRPASPRPPATVTGDGFVEAERARALDGSSAQAELARGRGPGPDPQPDQSSASLGLGGFGALRIPAHWSVDEAVLRVAHQEEGDVGTVRLRAAGGDVEPVVFSSDEPGCRLCLRARPDGEDVLDLRAAGFTEPASLNALTVDYTVALSPLGARGTARLDGVRLDVVVRAPALRPASGCLVADGYDREDRATCALVRTSAPAVTAFEGAVYAPSSVVDLGMTGVRRPVVSRGLVARAALLDLVPAPGVRSPAVAGPLSTVLFSAAAPGVAAPYVPAAHRDDSGFLQPEQGLRIDGVSALAPRAPAELTAEELGLDRVPSGAMVTSARLTVVHREQDTGPVELVVTPGPAAAAGSPEGEPLVFRSDDDPCELCPQPELGSSVLDLRRAGLRTAAQLQGMTVTYRVRPGGGSGAAELDGMRLDLGHARPALRARVAFERRRATVLTWTVPR